MKALWNGFGLISVGFLMMTSEACKMKESQASDLEGAKKTVSWEELKPGQKFRMSPADQSSKCYLPSGNGLALGNCGDQEYWVVVRAVNPYIKQVKSQIDNKCLQFVDKSLRAVECTDDAKPSDKNSWGDDFFSPLQHQYLSVSSDRLVPAYRRVCNVVGSRMRTGGKCSVVAEPTLFEGYSDSVTFSIGSESPSPDDKLIYRSKVIQARDERHTGSFASEIRWGHIPRIKSILVATQGEPYANKNNAWITGIQIHYASGEKFLIGNCALDQSGNCVVENSDHPKYPNPIAFDTDEYITSIGMKFGPGSIRADRMILEHAKDTRLIEFIIKTNKTGKKLQLWKGIGDAAISMQWLVAPNDAMIAGLFGSKATMQVNGWGESTLIHSMGAIFAAQAAYKAHNPDAFAKAPVKGAQVKALSQKDGTKIMGVTHDNARFHASLFNYNVRTGRPGPEGIASTEAFDRVFDDPAAKFSSTFYAGAMGNSVRTSSLRAYFTNSILVAIVIHPEGVEGLVQPEVYGEIPSKKTPDLYLELEAGDYISDMKWKTGIDGAGKVDAHDRAARFGASTINGLFVKTIKGKTASFAAPGVESQGWQEGLGRAGYAIVGFHGVYTTDSYQGPLNTKGILNLGAWIVEKSELP